MGALQLPAAGQVKRGRRAARQGLLLLQRGCGGAFHRAKRAAGGAGLQAALQGQGWSPQLLPHCQHSFAELAAAPSGPALKPPAALPTWQQGMQWRLLYHQWQLLCQLVLLWLLLWLQTLLHLLPSCYPMAQSHQPPP